MMGRDPTVESNDLHDLQTVDARGLKCPLPVLHTRRALLRLNRTARLEVLCTDPVSVIDIPNLVRELGFEMQVTQAVDDFYRFIIVTKDDRTALTPNSDDGDEG